MRFYSAFLLQGILALVSAICSGQATLEYKRLQAKYPGESRLILNNNGLLNIAIKDGKLNIQLDSYEEKIHMDNTAGLHSEGSVDYSDFNKILRIEAGTLIPDNNKYKKLPVKNFVKSEKISEEVFFEGLKNISFLYPSLTSGAKSYLKIVKDITEPRLIPSHIFQDNSPVVSSEYTVKTSPDVDIDFALFNVPDSAISFQKTVSKSEITYCWKLKNIEEFKYEAHAPSFYYSAPHIVVWIKTFKSNGQVQNILNSQNDLYKWYYSLAKDVNNDHDTELKAKVDSLVGTEKLEINKVKKIYYWVQENIKYIAVEDGMSGFIPRSASKVFDKRYGDCKDMASIIYKMLSYAGITSYMTWIGSNALPYTYAQLPTPAVDNHMITTYINNGKYYFLDATGKNTPFDIPTDFIQGKEALIGIDGDKYEIKMVPLVPLEKSGLVDSVNVSIEKNMLVGTGSSIISGYEHINLYMRLYDNTDEASKILRNYYLKGNNKFLVTSQSITDLGERDLPAKVNYSFTINEYVRRTEDEIYVNLNLDKRYQNELLDKNRKLSYQKDNKESIHSTVKLKIPKGYAVNFVPSNTSYKNEYFGFNISYTLGKDEIILNKYIYINFLMLEKADFKGWNSMIQELNKAYLELVSLKKIK